SPATGDRVVIGTVSARNTAATAEDACELWYPGLASAIRASPSPAEIAACSAIARRRVNQDNGAAPRGGRVQIITFTTGSMWRGTRASGSMADMARQLGPASGTPVPLADDVAKRERAFDVIRSVFAGYGFEPLQTPAFERLDVLMGKYGEDGDKLVFKILRRGEHEASGETDLALRYDHTVPLARVAAAYGSRLPSPYK